MAICSSSQTGKKLMLTIPVRTGHVAGPYRTRGKSVQDTWQAHTEHVEAPGDDTCQGDLAFWAYGWTNLEVTRVTTRRVTRGTR
jgi:hypothetical protein